MIKPLFDRKVFDTARNGIEGIIYTNCQRDISGEDWSFDDWYNKAPFLALNLNDKIDDLITEKISNL